MPAPLQIQAFPMQVLPRPTPVLRRLRIPATKVAMMRPFLASMAAAPESTLAFPA